MRSKDHYGNDQLSGQQVGTSLRVVGIILDRAIKARWMKAADIIGKGIYSIPILLDTLDKAAKEAKAGRFPQTDFKNKVSTMNEDPQLESGHDQDSSWKSILDLNSSLPRQAGQGTMVDSQMKQKNVGRLKAAMYQNYNQYQGYLPPKDVVQLTLAYSTVYSLGIDQGGTREAIDFAMDNDVKIGMVNIDKCIQAILEYIM